MKKLIINNLAQIQHAEIEFGDLTVLIGPQASGKSILLQMFKLIQDKGIIGHTLRKYGFDWKKDVNEFLSLYFGEGMSGIWSVETLITFNGKSFETEDLIKKTRANKENLFYIPAQRVLTLENGWPKNFMSFDIGDPYVVKSYSEQLRMLMEAGLGSGNTPIFPQLGRMKKELRDTLNNSIFHEAEVRQDTFQSKKRIVLSINNQQLPYMAWSAGQREFVPLLLGLYWLMPSSKTAKKQYIDYVVIEEPEMGLHPYAIQSLCLVFLELMTRGYKVILSTHSSVILDVIWAINTLRTNNAEPNTYYKLFNLPKTPTTKNLFDHILDKKHQILTYYFEIKSGRTSVKNISTLDPGATDSSISDWGGLLDFSSRASELVANSVK